MPCCSACVWVVYAERTLFLWDSTIVFTFGMQEYSSVSACASLKIMFNGCFFGKHLSIMRRNFFPRFVLTVKSYRGLYYVIFLLLFFRLVWFVSGFNVSLWPCPLSSRASVLVSSSSFLFIRRNIRYEFVDVWWDVLK